MTNSATDTLAGFITEVSYSELPQEVVDKAKLLILDALGCGFGSSRSKLANIAVGAMAQTSPGTAPILGREETANIDAAALLNAMLINALDFDDCSEAGHISATLVGTMLALLDQREVSGRDFLRAYVIGVEVAARVSQAVKPSPERFQEVWGLGTHQVFGAVASAAILRQLDKVQTLNAMGIADACAPVPSGQHWGMDSRPLSWIKDAVAQPAQLGVMSTTLAAAGFQGCKDILDGSTGFWRMAASDQCDFDLMTRSLGPEFYVMGASTKTYSCCWFIHPTLDAIQSIVNQHDLRHEDIAQIDVWSVSYLCGMFEIVKPAELVDAQFSLPYCAAVLLLGVQTGPDWFDPSLFSDETVLSIGSRVRIHPDSDCDEIFHTEKLRISARVEITTIGGDKFQASAAAPRGSPPNPISEDELIEKYFALTTPVIGAQKAEELKAFILNLDSQQNVDKLSQLVSL